MAARRLIIVMLFLLGISTAIAIVVPEPREPDSQEETVDSGASGTTGATGSTGETGAGGPGADQATESGVTGSPRLVESTIEPDSKSKVVRAEAGDRLVLTIETAEPTEVEIADLGLIQTTSRYAPAVFDLIVPGEPAKIDVTSVDGDEPLATINSGN